MSEEKKISALESIEYLRKRTIESVSLNDSDEQFEYQFTIFDSEKRSSNLQRINSEEINKLDYGLTLNPGNIFFTEKIHFNGERFSSKIATDLQSNETYISFLVKMPRKIRSLAFATQYHTGTPLWYVAVEDMMIYYDEIISSPEFLNFMNIFEESREIFETCRDTFDPDSKNFDNWNHFRSTSKNLLRSILVGTFDFYLENIEKSNLTVPNYSANDYTSVFDKNKFYNYIETQKETFMKNINSSWYPINKREITQNHFFDLLESE
ncbi:MAG: hypothetical protein EVA29_04145 [Candidatus Actinomarinales bacterium]|nr:MAG: hypothetical protein EVA29_04145 [Candidatus Actinomarinales bacterium]